MSATVNTILFGIYPYIAITVLILGCIIRYDREQYTWRSQSSQLLRRRQLIWGSVLFHVGILVVFLGHLVGLLTPIAIFDALGIGHGFKQMASMSVGGAAGVISLLGGLILLHRRLTDSRVRKTSSFSDIAILALLNLQLIIGLGTVVASFAHLDGSEMVKFMAWAQGLYTFDLAAASYIQDVHWVYKLHLFLGLTIFLIFPFTRLVHMLSAPLRYFWRSGYQVVRARERRARGSARAS
jgi:nitrate reductase gamma subunit